jgi:drug/metabolite transporter (DMT)-like permease
MDHALSAIFLGLMSAISWGAGDFCGGLTSKRNSAYSVVFVSQLAGGAMLTATAWLLGEPLPAAADLLWGAGAGLAGLSGIIALYRGLADGRMGIVSPMAAVVTAIIPVLFGLWSVGAPGTPQLVGFGVALLAVWFVSRGDSASPARPRDIGLGLFAGVGFGVFFVIIGHTSDTAVFWPLVAARATSLCSLLVFMRITRRRVLPPPNQWPLLALTGMLDTGGNVLYALAARAGRLDIAAVLSSLYPASTVLLARVILKEHMVRLQQVGVVGALVAVALIAWPA